MSRAAPRSAELDLTPVLNLVILLIPLLLMAQVGPLAMMETRLPSLCMTDCTGQSEALPLQVSLTAAGIVVAGHDGLLGDEARLLLPCEGSCGATSFDLRALDGELSTLLAARPETRAAAISAEDSVPYEALVGLMDTLREAGLPDITITAAPVSAG